MICTSCNKLLRILMPDYKVYEEEQISQNYHYDSP